MREEGKGERKKRRRVSCGHHNNCQYSRSSGPLQMSSQPFLLQSMVVYHSFNYLEHFSYGWDVLIPLAHIHPNATMLTALFYNSLYGIKLQ